MIGTLAIPSIVQSSKINSYQVVVPSKAVERPFKYVYSTEFLKDYAANMGIKYGLSPLQFTNLVATIMCESGFQVDPKHNNISWGIGQFTKPTWDQFGRGDIMNPLIQLDVMVSMWKNNSARWDCFRLGLYKKYL